MSVVGAVVIGLGWLDWIDIGPWVMDLEKFQADETVAALILILMGLTLDAATARHRHLAEIRRQRLLVLQATMRTVQDIVLNFANAVQIIELEAEEGPLSPESGATLRKLIADTTSQILALSALTDTPEKTIAGGQSIDFAVALPAARQGSR